MLPPGYAPVLTYLFYFIYIIFIPTNLHLIYYLRFLPSVEVSHNALYTSQLILPLWVQDQPGSHVRHVKFSIGVVW